MALKIIRPDSLAIRDLVISFSSAESTLNHLLENYKFFEDDYDEDSVEGVTLVDVEEILVTIIDRADRYNYFPEKLSIQLRGEINSGDVYVFDKKLHPGASLQIRKHSPDGFSWGYSGSGPAQLALAICLEIFGEDRAIEIYQRFKEKYIAPIPREDFEIDIEFSKADLQK